ncbi:RNA polymerase sigma factor [Algimonas arctica]|uniref:RNA polymerase sigma factor n=1 Tax=Algimonas arctica TaxID=1479486 RepID=UPI001672F245|nr:sigma-70 family RNA polymerase sigma factor [Algimonas arctica]
MSDPAQTGGDVAISSKDGKEGSAGSVIPQSASVLRNDATAQAEIDAERAPAAQATHLPNRAALMTEKSLSASKRDAIWLTAIADNRDATALTALFEVYSPKLIGWLMARGAGGSTAEDAVQDVMIKVWTSAHMFDPSKASFATWVYRMTRNRWIDHQRKHGRMDVRDPELMKTIADEEVPSAETGYMEQQDSHWVNDEIAKLTPSQQVAIRMAYMEFKTHKEISKETGLPLGTVKTRIRSAMQALKANMGERDPD